MLIALVAVCFTCEISAQELYLLGAAGTESTGTGGSVSWSLGEIITVTAGGPSNDVTQGFHQGNIYVTGVEHLAEINVSVYPNPTSEFVTVTCPYPVRVSIYDASGRLIAIHDLTIEVNQLNVTEFARGTYNLIFESTEQETKTARLVVM